MPSSDLADQLRQQFYDDLLADAPSRPDIDFQRICDAWQRATCAEWVWLWLHNIYPAASQWEIREVGARTARDRYIPEQLTAPGIFSVCEYARMTQTVEEIDDITTWRRVLNSTTYSVACRDTLAQMGCKSFLTVPFTAPKTPIQQLSDSSVSHLEPVHGTICAHFTKLSTPVRHPTKSLHLMAKLAASTIVGSYQAVQREILMRLNMLASNYLTRVSRRPVETRRDYLDRVIEIVKSYLRVKAVSIFYNDEPFRSQVRCLATTGIMDENARIVAPEHYGSVVYQPGQGLTGTCFSTGKPRILSAEEAAAHRPRYVEVLHDEIMGRNEAALYPITCPIDDDSVLPQRPRIRGVIRCSAHRSALRGGAQPFDPVDVQTLDFIAAQIGPVLETLTVRVQREQSVNVIKHDLYAPLAMIRHSADSISLKIDPDSGAGRINYFDLVNLKTAALVASNLVHQLDPDPGEVRDFNPQPIFLEADILARIQNMLQHFAKRENEMNIYFSGFREIPKLHLDRDLVERVFVNLLINAIKYGHEGTRIVVRAHEVLGKYIVEVTNVGDGIPPEESPHIFNQGFRGRSASRKFGHGLGLYIARSAMLRHGGELKLAADPRATLSNPSQVTFVMEFPESLRFTLPCAGVEPFTGVV
jgi:signal transduction histidine kinase